MSIIHKTAVIEGNVKLAEGVNVGPMAVIRGNVRIGEYTQIDAHAVIEGNVKIGKRNKIGIGSVIGSPPQSFKCEEETGVSIGDDNIIREYVTVNASSFNGKVTEIADKVMLMSYVHIAHDCRVEKEVVLANCVTLGGHIVVEEKAVIGGITPVHQFARIGKMSIVGGASRIPKDVAPYCLVAGNPAHVHGLNRVGLKRRNYSSQVKGHLKNAYRIIFRSGLNTSHALEKLKKSADCSIPEIIEMVSFIEQSKRGIIK